MPNDIFICGECQSVFAELKRFINHKKDGCQSTQVQDPPVIEGQTGDPELNTGNQIYIIQAPSADDISSQQSEHKEEPGPNTIENDGQMDDQSESYQVITGDIENDQAREEEEEKVSLVMAEQDTTSEMEGMFMPSATDGIELVRVPSSLDSPADGPIDLQIVVKQPPPEVPPSKPATSTGKKKGRPRKKPKEEEDKPPEPSISLPPERGPDGLYHCSRCKRTFHKERHIRMHKCLAGSDYVDITNKEAMAAEEGNSEPLDDDERDEDYKLPVDDLADYTAPPRVRGSGRPRGRPRKYFNTGKPKGMTETTPGEVTEQPPTIIISTEAPELDEKEAEGEAAKQGAIETTEGTPQPTGELPKEAEQGEAPMEIQTSPQKSDNAILEPSMPPKKSRGPRLNLPIFVNEEDKIAFEESMNVDFDKGVAHLYNLHVIQQDVNEMAPPPASRTSDHLSVFSCNVCSKVFMSLSQVKTHCLTHTDIKPFKCFKCDYATNSKGNIYTHMRKHTGQLFQCSTCEFRCANRTHLVEHEATHTAEKMPCNICKRDYNTVKSLICHVRRAHLRTQEGVSYLESLQGKHKKGPAMLHQCHVCNRKFKKKADRDRHLFVHREPTASAAYVCRLCGHASCRKEYFLKHVARHRVVFRCSLCLAEFTSCLRLNGHLTGTAHQDICSTQSELETQLERSIQISLFLPEPDGCLDSFIGEQTLGIKVEGGKPSEIAPNSLLLESDLSVPEDHTTMETDNTEEGSASQNDSDFPDMPLSVDPNEGQSSTEAPLDPEQPALENPPMDKESSSSDFDVFAELGYKPMTLAIFSKLRETFGNEECEYCGRLFFYKNDCAMHMRTHTGEKPFKCNECDFRSSTRENLRQHIDRDHHNFTYLCNECARSFRSLKNLLAHQQQKHKEQTADVQEVTCTKCNLTFDSLKRMKVHLEVKHSEIPLEDVRSMLTPSTRQQGKIGRKMHKCPYCAKTFCRGSSDLQKHLWIHQGLKPFKCSVCSYACRSKSNLTAHMIRHSSEKPFLCTHCGKEYKSRTALRWHVRSHRDGKVFKCNKCTYEAQQASHLKRHMEIHNIVKRYTCELCDYSANTIGYMKIHYTRHHKGYQFTSSTFTVRPMAAETKVYRCLSCDYMFGNLSDMKRHLRVRHHLAPEDMRSLQMLETPASSSSAEMVAQQSVPIITSADSAVMQGGISVIQAEADMSQTEDIQMIQLSQNAMEGASVEASSLQTLQYPDQSSDTKDLTTVTGLQGIIEGSQQDVLPDAPEQEVDSSVAPPVVEGGYITVNPEAIIVQQEQEVVLSQDELENQYVIRYVLPSHNSAEVGADNNSQMVQITVEPMNQDLLMSAGEAVVSNQQDVDLQQEVMSSPMVQYETVASQNVDVQGVDTAVEYLPT